MDLPSRVGGREPGRGLRVAGEPWRRPPTLPPRVHRGTGRIQPEPAIFAFFAFFACAGLQGGQPVRPDPDGWTPLPAGVTVVAAGRHADGTLWFAGDQGGAWIYRVPLNGPPTAARPALKAPLDAVATPDGDLWLSTQGEDELRLTRVAPDGAVRADLPTPWDVSGQTYDLATSGGAVVAVGVHNPITSGLTHGWFVGAASDGAALFAERLGIYGYGYLVGATALADGGFAAVGAIDKRPSLVLRAAEHTTSTTNTVTTFPILDVSGESRAQDVAPLGEELVVFGHVVDAETFTSLSGRLVVQRVGRDGTVRWSKVTDLSVAHVGEAIATPTGVAALASSASNPDGALSLVTVIGDGTVTTRALPGPAMANMIDLTAFLAVTGGRLELIQVEPGPTPRYRVVAL